MTLWAMVKKVKEEGVREKGKGGREREKRRKKKEKVKRKREGKTEITQWYNKKGK